MNELTRFIDENLIALSFGWVAAGAIASVLFRRSRGKAIFATVPPDAIFVEKWASGRSLRNIITKVGRAQNCLLVAVTPDTLEICPHFPFTLLFLPEVYGLDWKIPRSAINGVDRGITLFGGRQRIQIEFHAANNMETVELDLYSPGGFLSALAS